MATILTVDDSPSVRQMVARTLRDAGYKVIEGSDGKEALETLQDQQVDLVLSDLNMPNMDGLSFIRALRRLPDYRFIPVLILTTESSHDLKQKGRASGASGYVVKPFHPEKLLAAIRRVLGQDRHAT